MSGRYLSCERIDGLINSRGRTTIGCGDTALRKLYTFAPVRLARPYCYCEPEAGILRSRVCESVHSLCDREFFLFLALTIDA